MNKITPGIYYFQNRKSLNVIDLANGSSRDHTIIQGCQHDINNLNQIWRIVYDPTNNSLYNIYNINSETVMTFKNGLNDFHTNESKIEGCSYQSGNPNQMWSIELITNVDSNDSNDSKETNNSENDCLFSIKNKSTGQTLSLELIDDSSANGSVIQASIDESNVKQTQQKQWKIILINELIINNFILLINNKYNINSQYYNNNSLHLTIKPIETEELIHIWKNQTELSILNQSNERLNSNDYCLIIKDYLFYNNNNISGILWAKNIKGNHKYSFNILINKLWKIYLFDPMTGCVCNLENYDFIELAIV